MSNVKHVCYSQLLLAIFIGLLSGCASITEKNYPSAVTYALSLEGAPYRYGKASPEEGFDCSGFVQHVYAYRGIHLPRTVSQMAASLPEVAPDEIIAGDLVFFNTLSNKPSHVGLYIEDNKFIHAPSSRTGKVKISDLDNHYWRKHFSGVRRPSPENN